MMNAEIFKNLTNTRWLSPRVRLWATSFGALFLFYAIVFHVFPWLGVNKAQAFSRMSVVEMSPARQKLYAADLKSLLMKDPENIKMLLGQDFRLVMDKPDLARNDSMITVWQYRTQQCVLDVYLQPTEDTDYAQVMHYELRPRRKAMLVAPTKISAEGVGVQSPSISDQAKRACMKALISRHSPAPAPAAVSAPADI